MIVNASHRTAALHTGGPSPLRVRCLARRGMLYSECEAVDRVSLPPQARYDLVGRDDAEAAWYVLDGPLTLHRPGAPPNGTALGARDLLLAPTAQDVTLRAGPRGAELLCLTLTPEAVARRLPPRTPDTIQERT